MSDPTLAQGLGDLVLDLVGQSPGSTAAVSTQPREAARHLARQVARKAAATAGALALPPGPIGWLTVLPELLAVWRLQAQMVADIAALYGLPHAPTREQMLVCLFRHTAAQAVRDLAVRVGERWLVREASTAVLQRAAAHIGVHLSQRALGASISRWLPLVGALGVGSYAWLDTRQVAEQAIRLFEDARTVEPA